MKKLLIFAILLFANNILIKADNDNTNNHNDYEHILDMDFGCIDAINKSNIKYIDHDAFDYEYISEKVNKRITSTSVIIDSKTLYQEVINDYKIYKTSNDYKVKQHINKKYGLEEININIYKLIKI